MIVLPKLAPGLKKQSPTSRLDRPDALVWRVAFIASGFLLLAIGLSGLLAWIFGEPFLTQLSPAFLPLHYNAAIGLALWGGANLSLGRVRYRAAKWLAVTLGIYGFVFPCANALEVPLNSWAFALPVSTAAFPPGGLSIELALAFCLGSAAVVLSARCKVRVLHLSLPAAIGLILAVAGLALLVTQSGKVRPAGPSVLGTVGIAIAGLAMLTSVCRRGLPTVALGHLIPLTVGALGVGITFVLWLALNADQNRRIHRQVQFESANLQRLTRDRLTEVTNSIATQAEEWPNITPEKGKEQIGSYVGRLPGCLGVARIDEKLGLTWIESIMPAGLPQTIGELGVGDALTSAVLEGRNTALRPPRSNWSGSRVLILYAAHRNARSGLISVIRVQDLFSAIINASVIPGYAVAITEKEGTIFSRYDSERMHQDRWSQTLPLNYEHLGWQLTVWPAQEAMERESLSLPKLALTIGLFTTGLLALAVHLAQTARRRTFALENEVSERELAQRALAQSEEKYRTLIENLGQGIFLQDREHRYVAANRQFCKSIGREEPEIYGTTEADLFEPQRAATLAEEVRTVLAEGKTVETEEDTLKDGRRLCIRRVLTPVRDAAGRTTGVLGICWDVTEQRQLEVHVHQASKMDAIGQLAGGIAHDFNNLLTVILGNLELMLLNLYTGDSNRDLAISARNAASRATSLTQRLLGFSRRHQLDWSPTDVNATVDEVVQLLKRIIDPLIRIETHCARDLWPIQADPTQLNQVLMNLCLNARDAISGAGQITIETKCVATSEIPGVNSRNAATREFVKLSITDTGSGMPPEVKARMYEPFFTTKEVGKGTGLGLPMVFAIVRQHKGWIDCWSEVGKGTRFEIYLPRSEVPTEPAPEPVPVTPHRAGSGDRAGRGR